jgi:DNA-binding transcriptional ArsR family regulator
MTKYTPTHPTENATLNQVCQLAQALSDEGRVRVLLALREHAALCVCQLTELLDLAPSTVSKHLSLLRQAGLIESEKRGRWVYVRRAAAEPESLRASLFAWIDRALPDVEPAVAADCCRLGEILEEDPSELRGRRS